MAAQATLKTAQDALDKQQAAYDLNPKSISKDALDTAANAVLTAKTNLEVARRQRDLDEGGSLDLRHQQPGENPRRTHEILSVGERAARQIHAERPERWSRAERSVRRWEASSPRKELTTPTRKAWLP